jgi:hypothetical protein
LCDFVSAYKGSLTKHIRLHTDEIRAAAAAASRAPAHLDSPPVAPQPSAPPTPAPMTVLPCGHQAAETADSTADQRCLMCLADAVLLIASAAPAAPQ